MSRFSVISLTDLSLISLPCCVTVKQMTGFISMESIFWWIWTDTPREPGFAVRPARFQVVTSINILSLDF